jgi:glycosyltransferase involved in cell wall biosynthesis
LRVALNAHFYHHPGTGTGQYLQHLVRSFRGGVAPVEALPFTDGAPQPPPGGWPSGVAPIAARTLADPLGGNPRKLWWEQVAWPRLARRSGAAVHHVPHFAPPLVPTGPTAVTIHDLIQLIIPEYVTSPLVRAYNALVGRAAHRARLILVDSQASKRDVVRLLGVPESRVRVVYLAGDASVLRPVPPEEIGAVRRKYGLEGPFVFYFGGLDRRKNVPALIRALAALPPEVPWQLAISGRLRKEGSALFPDLPALAAELGVADRVRFLGFAPDEDKPALLRAATCFAFPSIYEGFGMDPLEALACGTPVVCSNRSSLPELMGDAALLVDPDGGGGAALTEALRRVLTDADLRADLAARGPVQAARFTWERCARETHAAYEAVLTSPPAPLRTGEGRSPGAAARQGVDGVGGLKR